MVKILDCTTRDGGHDTNWTFGDDFVSRYICCLENTGVDYFEIGYRNFYQREDKGIFYHCNEELLKNFYKNKNNLKIGVMVDTSRFSEKDFENTEYIDFVRIATHPDDISKTIEIAQFLKACNLNIFIQLMEIPNVQNKHYKILEKWKSKNILESLYIADSYSMVEPNEIKLYFEKLKNIGFEKISFHSHNGQGRAVENTLKAIELGAYSVDVSFNSMGGNTDAVQLLNILGVNTKNFQDMKNCL